jgi:hypothetical protein
VRLTVSILVLMTSKPILVINMEIRPFGKLLVFAVLTSMLMLSSPSSAVALIRSNTVSTAVQEQDARMANLKARANTELQRRTTSLATLISKINSNKRLISSQKDAFVRGINAEISSLTALKVKIDNDTDLAALKSDVQSVVISYRVYLLYIPQVRILSGDFVIDNSADRLTVLAAELHVRILRAKSSGDGTASLEALYSEMLTQIAAVRTDTTNADNLVLPLQPTGYPGNRPQLLAAQKDMVSGRTALVASLQDAKSIVQSLKVLEKSFSTTGSSSPAVSQ